MGKVKELCGDHARLCSKCKQWIKHGEPMYFGEYGYAHYNCPEGKIQLRWKKENKDDRKHRDLFDWNDGRSITAGWSSKDCYPRHIHPRNNQQVTGDKR